MALDRRSNWWHLLPMPRHRVPASIPRSRINAPVDTALIETLAKLSERHQRTPPGMVGFIVEQVLRAVDDGRDESLAWLWPKKDEVGHGR